MVCIKAVWSSLSTLTSALMYSPSVASVEATSPRSNALITDSKSPRRLRSRNHCAPERPASEAKVRPSRRALEKWIEEFSTTASSLVALSPSPRQAAEVPPGNCFTSSFATAGNTWCAKWRRADSMVASLSEVLLMFRHLGPVPRRQNAVVGQQGVDLVGGLPCQACHGLHLAALEENDAGVHACRVPLDVAVGSQAGLQEVGQLRVVPLEAAVVGRFEYGVHCLRSSLPLQEIFSLLVIRRAVAREMEGMGFRQHAACEGEGREEEEIESYR
mmetsp:Transcript_21683/g.60294  ORF Transcript_21683/g.60294 Transcript_21683/m.60294 type:complete len:273 (-) Transcript_21683:208-1026(-)